jgi:hypothetical protein
MNHQPAKTGVPIRKKTSSITRPSCKIEYHETPTYPLKSTLSEFLSGDLLLVVLSQLLAF